MGKRFCTFLSRTATGVVCTLAAVTLIGFIAPTWAQARPRAKLQSVQAANPHHDGYTLVTWGSNTADEINAALDRVKLAGVTHIQIPYLGCQTSASASQVGDCEIKQKQNAVEQARLAIAKGFTATFFPIVLTPDWKWRGIFDPTDVDGWFESYERWITQVAAEATELGMTDLVVSSETTALYQYEAHWIELIGHLRQKFKGALILTANWNDLEHEFWSSVDAIGVSAYFPLRTNETPTQRELDLSWARWRNELLKLANRFNKPIHLTEIGYPSSSNAAQSPWAMPAEAVSDFELQERCFEAFRKAWVGQPALVGANIWAFSPGRELQNIFSVSYDVLGKPAEKTILKFFESRRVARRKLVPSAGTSLSSGF